MEIVPPVETSVGLVGMMICFDVSLAHSKEKLHIDALSSSGFQKFLYPLSVKEQR